MNISGPFIQRPVATTLLTIAIALAGILAFFQPARILAAANRFRHHHGGNDLARR